MAQITGGLVSVEDSKPHSNDEYGRKKVRVDLSFAVGEGEDYTETFDLASEAATNRVSALLNGTALRVVGGGGTSAEAETPASPPAPAARRTRRTAAQIEADNAAKAAGHSPSGSAGGEQTSDDPASISLPDETPGDDDTFDIEAEAEAEAPVAEESFDIEPDAGGDPITDADLNSAVQKKNAEIKNPNAIRALIGTYNPDPKSAFQLRQIPADKRGEFIAKLNALTKAA